MSLQSLNARSQTFNPCEHLRLYTINKGCDLMEALVLIGGLFYIIAVGFWVTRRFPAPCKKVFTSSAGPTMSRPLKWEKRHILRFFIISS